MTILPLLHLCDSLFPIGGFAYSEGLEAATAGGHVAGADDLREWLNTCLDEGIGRCEGPAVVMAWHGFVDERWPALEALDGELTAMRPASTLRQSSRAMGLRLVKAWHRLHHDTRLAEVVDRARAGALGPTLPVAFAAACASAGIGAREAVEGFSYTRLAATISCAMRLMPIGHTGAHALLAVTLDRVPQIIDQMVARGAQPESFAPAMDLAAMSQPYVHSRLFRS